MPPTPRVLEWGVLLKARLDPDSTAATEEQLQALLEALPGEDKRMTGGGRDFTLAWWVAAPDASAATRIGASTVRRVADGLGLGALSFLRAHAASVEGRQPALGVADDRIEEPGWWAVDIKVAMPATWPLATAELVIQVAGAIAERDVAVTFHGDREKFLMDDGTGFTIRSWARGTTVEHALQTARAAVLEALTATGLADGSLVRLKTWGPAALRSDIFPGIESRRPLPTGEYR